ncbi:MAG: hypothetical protein M1823_001625 [Watsoniomyces obsoletus]|nr:MAG: hypothetical protein M1823_001625 [Watsoniomyces obsoletus]
MDRHTEIVTEVAARVRLFHERQQPFRIYHGSTNSTRESQYRRDNTVDTSRLTNVLKIDTHAKTALVEPNVPMDRLVEATLRHNLVPPVVMEFPGITAGGGFAGTAGESSSFKYGMFDRTVNWIEIVLANGDIVTASRSDKPDLLYGAAASFGTLGVTTLLELQLIEAKTYVKLSYIPISSVSEAVTEVRRATEDPSTDYVDGILLSAERGVVCVGRLTNHVGEGLKIQRFTRARDPWFYLHAIEVVNRREGIVREAIPLVDYLFRYDRGAFWTGKFAFQYFVTPFNRITRWALDRYMHTRVMYHALHKSGHTKRYMIQDVAVPYPGAEDFVQYLDTHFGHYPLWICPLRQTGQWPNSPHGLLAEKPSRKAPDMLLNFGVWGPGSTDRKTFVDDNRGLEHKVQSLGGRKWLYACAFYTEEEFWDIYDKRDYDALRAKYHATHLPTIYDKVKVDWEAEQRAISASWRLWLLALFWSIWPLSGLYGVYKATIGGDYLLPRESSWRSRLIPQGKIKM